MTTPTTRKPAADKPAAKPAVKHDAKVYGQPDGLFRVACEPCGHSEDGLDWPAASAAVAKHNG